MSRIWILLGLVCGLSFFAPRTEAEIVAYWDFESFNATVGGPGFDLTAVNGASIAGGGRFGNAASFTRSSSQYAFTGGDVLTANADFSYSV